MNKLLQISLAILVTIGSIGLFAYIAYADTAGNTNIGANTYTMGSNNFYNPPGVMITVTAAGSITKVSAYVRNTVSAQALSAALYAGSANSRGALIATTNTTSVGTTFGWVDFTFATPQSVSATTYWLHFNGTGGNGPGGNVSEMKYDTGGAANTGYILSDVGSPIYSTDNYSMYATYTPTATGAPKPIAGIYGAPTTVRGGNTTIR